VKLLEIDTSTISTCTVINKSQDMINDDGSCQWLAGFSCEGHFSVKQSGPMISSLCSTGMGVV
jgi:hypothetical protein